MQRARRFFRLFGRYSRNQDGAVTVDFVVLTALIVGMLLSLFAILTDTVFQTAATGVADNVTEAGTR